MSDPRTFESTVSQLATLRARVNAVLIGQEAVVDQILIALLANGHVLVEGVPGLGKTLLIRTLATCLAGEFKRIQFTPDLMPADISGHVIYDMKESAFRMRKGPVFTNLLLADEINRAPAKTQSALLEVMQDRQVTLEGRPHKVPSPFLVMATQNPIEQEGTYPLPEAQLDRFLLKVFIDYPSLDDEMLLTQLVTRGQIDNPANEAAAPVVSAAEIEEMQAICSGIQIDEQVMDYAVRLCRITRESAALMRGAGPRASISLVRVAKAHALMDGRDFVSPDDVKVMALPVMRHRVALSADMEIDGLTSDDVLTRLFNSVDAPRT
jgi:MoxR-like ATPase